MLQTSFVSLTLFPSVEQSPTTHTLLSVHPLREVIAVAKISEQQETSVALHILHDVAMQSVAATTTRLTDYLLESLDPFHAYQDARLKGLYDSLMALLLEKRAVLHDVEKVPSLTSPPSQLPFFICASVPFAENETAQKAVKDAETHNAFAKK